MSEPCRRIVYLVSSYPALTHTFVLWEVQALRALGFEVDTVSINRIANRPVFKTPNEICEEARTFFVLPFGFHVIYAHLSTILRFPVAYIRGFLLALRLGNSTYRALLFHVFYFLEAVVVGHYVQKRGHNHIHTHFSSTVGLLASRIFGLDFSITIHGPDEFRDVIAFRLREKVSGARFIRTISQYAGSQIMLAADQADWHKIRVCRIGVDHDKLLPRSVPLPAGLLRLSFVGRLTPVKGLHVLIAAAALLVERGCSFSLSLAGIGATRPALERLVNSLALGSHVVFVGAKNHDEVIDLYRQTDIFVMSSLAEGVPVVLMEAMSMQIPCVCPWVNGIPELIDSAENGLLVAPADVLGLANALELLIGDPHLPRRLGHAGREKTISDYNLPVNMALLAELFREYILLT